MITFLIEPNVMNDVLLPAQDYGWQVINLIEYKNWWHGFGSYSFILTEAMSYEELCKFVDIININDVIPVGSVQFCLNYYKACGISNIKPLNIPKELWPFTKRKVCIGFYKNIDKTWFAKSADRIVRDIDVNNSCDKLFTTEFIDNIISEWRLFVYNRKIIGLRCYDGDMWTIPDKEYCESIVDFYDKRAYTLDVMIYKDKHDQIVTDIVELHDFFACGTYGFNDPKLVDMLICTHRHIVRDLRIIES